MAKRLRREARHAANILDAWGRRLGVLAYRPEQRSSAEWSRAYGAGSLDYYAELDELARYSVIAGYINWAASADGAGARSVLDVGCGPGLLRARLEGPALGDYVGIDLSETAIDAARAAAYPRARFLVGDVTTTELDRFDVVVLNEVLYYAADAGAFLGRIGALTNDNGIVIVSMWRHPGDHKLWNTVDEVLPVIDRVEVRNRANAMNQRGWIVACGRPRVTPAS